MGAEEVLAELGGVADRRQLQRHLSRHAVDRAVARGSLVRVARGRFALPGAERSEVAAARVGGTLAVLSAAEAAGWELARPPDRPWVSVPRHRGRVDGRGIHVVYSDERETDPVRIVLQCARHLPWPQALAVADSALRSGQVDPDELVVAAAGLAGPGARSARRVAAAASAAKTNPLESVLHAHCLDVPGLHVVPQAAVDLDGLTVHPDLVDRRLRVVVEAEGWLFHGATPMAFDRDVRRYTLLVADAWRVVRFTRQHVMAEPGFVRTILERVVAAGTMAPGGRGRPHAGR